MFRVPRPRIETVRRHVPGRASSGDFAVARLEPGLLRLLCHPVAGEPQALGEGYAPLHNLPVGLAISAAVAVIGPETPPGGHWLGREASLVWRGLPAPGRALLARASLIERTAHSARFAVSAGTEGEQPQVRGTLTLAAMRGEAPAGFPGALAHARLREQLELARDEGRVVASGRLRLVSAPRALWPGSSGRFELEVGPGEGPARQDLAVAIRPPSGGGLSPCGESTRRIALAPGERARVGFEVQADRPDEVNLGQPWALRIELLSGRGVEAGLTLLVAVPDPAPGRIFYVLTEDCETIDGGPSTGDYPVIGCLGNQNGFMDPEEYLVQMVRKPDRMNAIAERHGARFTHFFTATQRFAAAWAQQRSTSGAWEKVLAELDESVCRGSALHEYAPHIHFGFEPDSKLEPSPRLVYDPGTDGLLPNRFYDPAENPGHRYHGWDGAAKGFAYVKRLGDLADGDSKAGSLRRSLRYLARLAAGQRQPLVARSGAFDFGQEAADQAASQVAYRLNGLRGNSDAYAPQGPPGRGRWAWFAAPGDIRAEVERLEEAELVELGFGDDSFNDTLESWNAGFAARLAAARGPGVHLLQSMTHAMFMRGAPDPFRDVEGGDFDKLDRHLAWVRQNHPEVEFATASEALLEYLDYYTPRLLAEVEPRPLEGDPERGVYRFPVRLLGRGLRVSPQQPAAIEVTAPACFDAAEVAQLSLWQAGEELARRNGFSPPQPLRIGCPLGDRDSPVVLEVQLERGAVEPIAALFRRAPAPLFADRAEPRVEPPLLSLRAPAGGRYFPDLGVLLMNPLGGGKEPLGRRIHPQGGVTLGATLHAAGARGVPVALRLRWLALAEVDREFSAAVDPLPGAGAGEGEGEGLRVVLRDVRGRVLSDARVLVLPPPPASDPGAFPALPRPQDLERFLGTAWAALPPDPPPAAAVVPVPPRPSGLRAWLGAALRRMLRGRE